MAYRLETPLDKKIGLDYFRADMNNDDRGKRLASARDALGISQAEMARRLRVSQPAVSAWESGASFPRRIRAVAEAYGIPVDELV